MFSYFTIGNIVFFVFLALFLICISVRVFFMQVDRPVLCGVVSAIVSLILFCSTVFGVYLYNTNTASGARALKDNQSEISNGIDRSIKITAEDGREIFYYEGKVDVESNHEDNYIKFEGEDGKRYIIYYGIQDTIQIIEK